MATKTYKVIISQSGYNAPTVENIATIFANPVVWTFFQDGVYFGTFTKPNSLTGKVFITFNSGLDLMSREALVECKVQPDANRIVITTKEYQNGQWVFAANLLENSSLSVEIIT